MGEWSLATQFASNDTWLAVWADAQKLAYSKAAGWIVSIKSIFPIRAADMISSLYSTGTSRLKNLLWQPICPIPGRTSVELRMECSPLTRLSTTIPTYVCRTSIKQPRLRLRVVHLLPLQHLQAARYPPPKPPQPLQRLSLQRLPLQRLVVFGRPARL